MSSRHGWFVSTQGGEVAPQLVGLDKDFDRYEGMKAAAVEVTPGHGVSVRSPPPQPSTRCEIGPRRVLTRARRRRGVSESAFKGWREGARTDAVFMKTSTRCHVAATPSTGP